MKTICALLGAAFAAFPQTLLAATNLPQQFILAVETGQDAPFPGGPATFSAVTNPVINVRGDIVFRAQIAGAGITAANNEGLYRRDSAGVITRIVGETDVIADVNLPVSIIGAQHNLLNDGSIVLLASLGGAATAANNGALLLAVPGQPVKTLAREGQPIGSTGFNIGPTAFEPGAGIPPQPLFAFGDVNGDGAPDLISFAKPSNVVPAAGGTALSAILYLTDGVVQLGAKEGDPVPGFEPAVFGDIGNAFNVGGISPNTGVIFTGTDPSGLTLGIFQQTLDGSVQPIVLSGDKAKPFGGGFLFGGFITPAVGGDGNILFNAFADKPPTGGGPPPFRNGLLTFQKGINGKLVLVAGRDRAAPGIPGNVVYSSFGETESVGPTNRIIYTYYADLFDRQRPNDPSPRALFVNGAYTALLARQGGPAPGFGPGATIKQHGAFTSDGERTLYWNATVTDENQDFETIFATSLAGKKPLTSVLVKVSEVLDFEPPATTRTVTDVIPFSTVARGGGAPLLASPEGLVLACNFKGGTTGLVFCPKQEAPIFQPDIIVQSGPNFTGFGVYPSDAQQRINLNVPVGNPGADILLIVTNDGNVMDDIKITAKIPKLRGPAGIADYRGFFLDNDVNGKRASDLVDGTGFTVSLLPSQSYAETIHIFYPSTFDGYKGKDERNIAFKLRATSAGDKKKDDNLTVLITIPQ